MVNFTKNMNEFTESMITFLSFLGHSCLRMHQNRYRKMQLFSQANYRKCPIRKDLFFATFSKKSYGICFNGVTYKNKRSMSCNTKCLFKFFVNHVLFP